MQQQQQQQPVVSGAVVPDQPSTLNTNLRPLLPLKLLPHLFAMLSDDDLGAFVKIGRRYPTLVAKGGCDPLFRSKGVGGGVCAANNATTSPSSQQQQNNNSNAEQQAPTLLAVACGAGATRIVEYLLSLQLLFPRVSSPLSSSSSSSSFSVVEPQFSPHAPPPHQQQQHPASSVVVSAPFSSTLAHFAAASGNADVLACVLKQTKNNNDNTHAHTTEPFGLGRVTNAGAKQNDEGDTPAHLACEVDAAGCLALLIAQAMECTPQQSNDGGVPPSLDFLVHAKNSKGLSALHTAILHNSTKCVELIYSNLKYTTVSKPLFSASLEAPLGLSPLHLACMYSNAIAEAPADAPSYEGYGSYAASLSIVGTIISDMNMRGLLSSSSSDVAAGRRNNNADNSSSSSERSAESAAAATADLHLSSRSAHHITPLHFACAVGAVPLVALLLKEGALIDVKDHWGYTPLHVCALNNSLTCAILLVQDGADVNVKDDEGRTTLELAAGRNLQELVEYLVGSAHCPLTPALLAAIKAGADKSVAVLLAAGAALPPNVNSIAGAALMSSYDSSSSSLIDRATVVMKSINAAQQGLSASNAHFFSAEDRAGARAVVERLGVGIAADVLSFCGRGWFGSTTTTTTPTAAAAVAEAEQQQQQQPADGMLLGDNTSSKKRLQISFHDSGSSNNNSRGSSSNGSDTDEGEGEAPMAGDDMEFVKPRPQKRGRAVRVTPIGLAAIAANLPINDWQAKVNAGR